MKPIDQIIAEEGACCAYGYLTSTYKSMSAAQLAKKFGCSERTAKALRSRVASGQLRCQKIQPVQSSLYTGDCIYDPRKGGDGTPGQ